MNSFLTFLNRGKFFGGICLAASITMAATAATEAPKALHERGWLGGEYRLVKAFPKPIAEHQRAGVLIYELRTNTPAALAGLREGDLILELNHIPITRLKDFHLTIDQATPGTLLTVTASRDGQITNYDVLVGREKFRHEGTFAICVPSFVHFWKLWPAESYQGQWKYWPQQGDPGLSAVFIGYSINPGNRNEISPRHKQADNYQFRIWLAIFEVSKGEKVTAQEIVAARRTDN